MPTCASCRSEQYCSKACQREAWPSHKQLCKEVSLKLAVAEQQGFKFLRRSTEAEIKQVLTAFPECPNPVYAKYFQMMRHGDEVVCLYMHRCEPDCGKQSENSQETNYSDHTACQRCGTFPRDPANHERTCDEVAEWLDSYKNRGWRHLEVGTPVTGPRLTCMPYYTTTHKFERPDGSKVAIRFHQCDKCADHEFMQEMLRDPH